jgi:hypothetical protein
MAAAPDPAAAQAAADAAAAAAAKGGEPAAKGSAMSGGQEKPETWIPEKYHVRAEGKKDGPIDEAASVRALAKGYNEITKRMVDIGLPPEDADKYELTAPEGFDVAEFRKDPQMADFLKGAHSMGLTNKQVNYVIGKYLEAAPELVAGAQALSNDEAISQLKLVWKSDADLAANLKGSYTAASRLAESVGLSYDDVDKAFGNNPMFIRLMAALAKQMGEDVPASASASGGADVADFDTQVKALRTELDTLPERDTKGRAAVREKLDALYSKRYGNAQRAPLLTIRSGTAAAGVKK